MGDHHRHLEHAPPAVPVVDLTGTTNALLWRITWLRTEALNLITTAIELRDHADQLEVLLGTLQGGALTNPWEAEHG